jgi:hypothetical protein
VPKWNDVGLQTVLRLAEQSEVAMRQINFTIKHNGSDWTIEQDGDVGGNYATKEAAFETAAAAASNAIKEGHGVLILVPAPVGNESALGS